MKIYRVNKLSTLLNAATGTHEVNDAHTVAKIVLPDDFTLVSLLRAMKGAGILQPWVGRRNVQLDEENILRRRKTGQPLYSIEPEESYGQSGTDGA